MSKWQFPWSKRAALPPFSITAGPPGLALQTWSGASVTEDSALRVASVWACVRLLSDSVSTLPVDVFRRGERDPITTPAILETPSAGMPLHEFVYATMCSLLLRGNAYGIITARQGANMLPAQVELVHPDRVGVQVNEDGTITYRVLGKEIDAFDIWHVRRFVMPGSVTGLSPVEYARQSIGLGLATEQFGGQWFGDSAVPSGMLVAQGKLTPEQAAELQTQWTTSHGKRRKTAVLGGGIAYTPITVKPEESQFIETMKLNAAQIARVFGVPAAMIGAQDDNSLTYATVESRALDYLRYSLSPWLVCIESALDRLLPARQFTKFKTGGMLKADIKTRYETYALALQNGILSLDEVRELEDLPPLPDDAAPPAPTGNGAGTVEAVV